MDIKEFLLKNNLDAILITSMINIRYFSQFTGTEAKVLITNNDNYIFVDSRYYEQAKMQCDDYQVILIKNNDFENMLHELVTNLHIKNIGFEGNKLDFYSFNKISTLIKANYFNVDLTILRAEKNEDEINFIKKACLIAKDAYEYIFSIIKPGMSEKEVALKMQLYVLKHNAEKISFDTIVASGLRSSLPHGVASDKIIEENDFVTIDFGCFYQGYCSDFTRTICVGLNPNKKLKEIYNIVLEAQQLAIKAIRPGIRACDIDKIARDYITKKGYGEYFGHGLGHGIGLEIHELPNINASSLIVLKPNHIITIEPGIYLPELGGVRIEDDILVTEKGYENLTNLNKDLLLIQN
ncbi:MAG: aminopeptidase P family protein [Bacilli bacterium]|jgi:Xaa-Pro aminopeptidase|nr:aminopeptidase P family protein [Bacilli bacterium]